MVAREGNPCRNLMETKGLKEFGCNGEERRREDIGVRAGEHEREIKSADGGA